MRDPTPATPDPNDLPPINLGDGDDSAPIDNSGDSDDAIKNAQAKPLDFGQAPSTESAKLIGSASAKIASSSDEFSASADSLTAAIEQLTKAMLDAEAPEPADKSARTNSESYESSSSQSAAQEAEFRSAESPIPKAAGSPRTASSSPKAAGSPRAASSSPKAASASNASKASSSAKASPANPASEKAKPIDGASNYAGPKSSTVENVTNFAGGVSGSVSNIATSAAMGAAVGGPVGAIAAGGLQAVAEAGKTAAAAFGVLKGSVEGAASRLDSYSGAIASANAHADERQILGDVKRAQFVGEDVGRYTDVASKFSQHGQDLEATLMKAGLAVLNPLLEVLEPIAEFLLKNVQHFTGEMLDSLGKIIQMVAMIAEQEIPDFAIQLQRIGAQIKRIADKGEENQDGLDINEFMASFLGGHGMGSQANAPLFKDVPAGRRKKLPAGGPPGMPGGLGLGVGGI